jgi:hypothetical protein
MEFENQIKKEVTEVVILVLFGAAGIRVTEYGTEKTAREATTMTREECLRL